MARMKTARKTTKRRDRAAGPGTQAASRRNRRRGRPSAYGIQIRSASDYCDLVHFEMMDQNRTPRDIEAQTVHNGQKVSRTTVAKHMQGLVQNPQLRTACGILMALGYEVRMRKS